MVNKVLTKYQTPLTVLGILIVLILIALTLLNFYTVTQLVDKYQSDPAIENQSSIQRDEISRSAGYVPGIAPMTEADHQVALEGLRKLQVATDEAPTQLSVTGEPDTVSTNNQQSIDPDDTIEAVEMSEAEHRAALNELQTLVIPPAEDIEIIEE